MNRKIWLFRLASLCIQLAGGCASLEPAPMDETYRPAVDPNAMLDGAGWMLRAALASSVSDARRKERHQTHVVVVGPPPVYIYKHHVRPKNKKKK